MCDYLSDLKNLPTSNKEGADQTDDTVCKNRCCPGSQCLCLEDGSVWILGKDTDKWTKHKTTSSVGTIVVEGDVSTIPRSSIESLFL